MWVLVLISFAVACSSSSVHLIGGGIVSTCLSDEIVVQLLKEL